MFFAIKLRSMWSSDNHEERDDSGEETEESGASAAERCTLREGARRTWIDTSSSRTIGVQCDLERRNCVAG